MESFSSQTNPPRQSLSIVNGPITRDFLIKIFFVPDIKQSHLRVSFLHRYLHSPAAGSYKLHTICTLQLSKSISCRWLAKVLYNLDGAR